jgi:autotransporter-associated beta strand protein
LGSSDNWSDAGNWDALPANGDFLGFDGNLRTNNNNNLLTSAGDITFATTAAAFTLSGNALTLTTVSGIINNNSDFTVVETVGLAGLTIGIDQNWSNFGLLTVPSPTNLMGHKLSFGGSGNTTVSGVISDSVGGGSIIKNGLGTLTLENNNTYAGGTALNGGTLLIASDTGLGSGTLTINGGAFGIISSVTLANNVVANSDVNLSLSDPVFFPKLTFNGTFNLGGGTRTITNVNSDGEVVFAGAITNGTGLTLTQSANGGAFYHMIGAVSNTYTGLTTVDGALLLLEKPAGFIAIPGNLSLHNATLEIANNNPNPIGGTTITIDHGLLEADTPVSLPQAIVLTSDASFAGSGDSTLSGVISGPGSFRVVNSFGGTVTLNNNSNNYSGGTELESGTLFVDANHALGTGPLTVTTSSATLASHVDGTTLPNDIVVKADFSVAPATTGAGLLTLSGNVDLNGATRTISSLTYFSTTIFAGSISNGGVTLTSSGPGIIGFFAYTGATANTYTGLTTIDNSNLNLDKSVTNGAILGDLLIKANGGVGIRQDEQIADTSKVTIESMGLMVLGAHNETIGSLFGAGDVLLNDGGGGPGGTLLVGAGDFSGVIRDDGEHGNLTKVGPGTLILRGANTYNGTTNINNGVLQLDGSIDSATFVNSGGTLAGTGTVFNNVTNSGVVSPGDSPGTLHVNNAYVQNATGTLRIEIGGLAPGQFDQLQTGTASLNGTLQLVRLNLFTPQVGDAFTILTAAGGVSNQFSALDRGLFNTLITPTVVYNPNDVMIVFVQGSFAGLSGLTPNQRAVAHELNEVVNVPRAMELIDFLDTEPLGNLPHDYDLIAPEELASIYEIGFSQAVVQNMNLQHRMDDIRAGSNGFCGNGYQVQQTGGYSKGSDGKVALDKNPAPAFVPAPDNRWGVFVSGSGDFVNVGNDDSNAHGYDITTGNVTVGADYRFGDHFALGIDGGYAGSTADLVDNGRVSVDGGKVGGYATVYGYNIWGSVIHVDGAIGGGWNSYDTRRTGLQDESVRGSTNGSEFNALLAYGGDWHFGCLLIGTWSSIQYTTISIDKFTEQGSLAPLQIQDQDEYSLRGTTGVRVAYDLKCGHAIIRPEVRAAWQHESGDRAYPIDARFASGAGDVFTVHGPEIGRDSALVDAGLAIQWNNRISTYVYYDGVLGRSNYNNNAVSGGFRLSF